MFRWSRGPKWLLLLSIRGVPRQGNTLVALGSRHASVTTAALIAGSITIATICAIALSSTLSKLHDDAIDRSKRESAEFAAVLAGQTSRSVEAINLVLEELAHRVASRLDQSDDTLAQFADQETHLYLKQRLSRLPFADVITIVNASGRIVS